MALCSLLIRSLSMMFRVWLTGMVGTEVLGIYQLILTVYAFFLLISTSGISVTATRLVGDFLAKGEADRAKYTASKLIGFSSAVGLVLAVILFFSAELLSCAVTDIGRSAAPLRILAVSLPFAAFSAAVRGYFTAKRKMLRISGEQILEQISEIGVCVFAFTYLTPKGFDPLCAAALGTTAAEILSFFYSFAIYFFDVIRIKEKNKPETSLLRSSLPIALPCTASSGLRSALAAAENMLIPVGLMKYGAQRGTALSEYGIISGMAMPVIVFPSVFILPFASLIITEMSQADTLGHKNGIRHISQRMISATLKYSLPVMFLFIFFANEIGSVLYNNSSAGFYIAALAPVVPLMYLDSSVDGMLKGLDQQTSYLLYNVIDSVLRVIVTYFLLPVFGTLGVVFIIIFSELFNTFLSLMKLIKVTKLKINIFDMLLRPCISILIPCLILNCIPSVLPQNIDLLLRLFICIMIYLPLCTGICIGTSKKVRIQKTNFES